MTNPDPVQRAQLSASEKVARMKNDPEATIFGQFKGSSRNGRVTMWVDVLGRAQRFRIEPNSVREGDEAQLIRELHEASTSAQQAANLLDFNMAELAHELGALTRTDETGSAGDDKSGRDRGRGASTERRDDDQDDWDDFNENRSFLR